MVSFHLYWLRWGFVGNYVINGRKPFVVYVGLLSNGYVRMI